MNVILPRQSRFPELRSGALGVRLAAGVGEIEAAQELRYAVFFDEMGAQADSFAAACRRDQDQYDEVADHLIVVDHDAADEADKIIATYRLIDAEAAADVGGFYSEAEFDISPLLTCGARLLELGRSCVHRDHRGGRAMQLMWRGLAAYVSTNDIDVMFGCASLPGTDPAQVAMQLAYLHHAHLTPPAMRPRALPGRRVVMDGTDAGDLDPRVALAGLPPLIKGYLRLGGTIGDGAVVDTAFNTVDVAVVVQTAQITARYQRHYDRDLAA